MTFLPEGVESIVQVRDRMGVEDLGRALASGRLIGLALDSWGKLNPIDKSEWTKGVARDVIQSGRTIGRYNPKTGQRDSGDAIVIRVAKTNHKPVRAVSSTPVVELDSRRTAAKGGRPPKYDWEAIWLEITAELFENGTPKTQSAFVDRVSLRLGERSPGETELKQRISKLWQRLGLVGN
jgi:hypothetical protein